MIGRIFYTLFVFFLLFVAPLWVGIVLMIFGMYRYTLYLEPIVALIMYQTLFLPTTASTSTLLMPFFLALCLFVMEKVKPLLRK